MDGQPPAAKDHFRSLEGQNPVIIIRHDPGHKVNHTGNLVGNLFPKVGADRTDLVTALAGKVTAPIFMADQDDVLIVQTDQPLDGIQKFGSHHIPSPEGIITFMLPALPITDIHPASLIGIFQKVNHNGFEVVLFLLQFGHGISKDFPRQLPLGQPAFHRHGVPDSNVGGINKLDVAIRVQHQRVRKLVGKKSLAAEGCAINPHNLLLGGVQVTPFILGKNHIIPSFLTKFFIFTPPAKVVRVLLELGFFNHVFYIGQEVHNLVKIEGNLFKPRFSHIQGFPQPVPELGQGFCFFLPDLHLGNKQEIHIPDPVAGVGQLIEILVFMQLTGNHVAFGIAGIFEVVQIKGSFINRGQIIHEADKISIPNGKFKGSARWQQCLCLGDQGFQLHHFVNVIIRQDREAGSVEVKGLFNPFFNARVKGCPQNQGVVRFHVRDGV